MTQNVTITLSFKDQGHNASAEIHLQCFGSYITGLAHASIGFDMSTNIMNHLEKM